MKLTDLKINGMIEPIGYDFTDLRVAWKVVDVQGKKQSNVCIELSDNVDFSKVLTSIKGNDLSQTGTVISYDLLPMTRYYVRVSVTDDLENTANAQTFFETAKDEIWTGQWVTGNEDKNTHIVLQKSFHLDDKVSKARLYISGLGLFETSLNGDKIGDEVLAPYYSRYPDEVQYLTFDVTDALKAKDNVLEIALGNGWYKGRFGLNGQKENFGSEFKAIAELHLTYENDEKAIIATDKTWSYHLSQTQLSDIYDGEEIDFNIDDSGLKPVKVTSQEGKLIPRYSLPVREQEALKVKEVIQTPAGEVVLDFGQNFAGYVAVKSKQPKGTHVLLEFGEILQDGNFCHDNYRSARSEFAFVSDGQERLVKPRFTYFGFRYVRVTGWVGELNSSDFVGVALYSDMKTTGSIETGHKGINQLFSNTLWGQKSNFIDFPTDCPQRDERLGWTGDAQVFSGTASYNMDTAAFYNKFLHDLRTEQVKYDGILPGVIPVFEPERVIFSSVWGDLATILPTVLMEHYGDSVALSHYYPMMKDWVDKITKEDKKRGQRYLYDFGNQLGDWLALDGRTSQSMEGGTDTYFIGSCYYAKSVKMTAEAAKILGNDFDCVYYNDLYEKIRHAILAEYFSASGRLVFDTQTAYIVALHTGIYSNHDRLVTDLKTRLYKDCYRLTGGFVGAPLMCRVFAENGLIDEAFYFLTQPEFPGWMHCIDLGATTIWERWNSVLDNGKLSGKMMNSLNHYAYGAIVEFLYRNVAGLKAAQPGFKSIDFAPQLSAKLQRVQASFNSPYGIYQSSWKILENGEVTVSLDVPFNASAEVHLPYYSGEVIGKVTSGHYEWQYQPTKEVRGKFNRNSIVKDWLKDSRAREVIKKESPLLDYYLMTGNEDFLYENLETLPSKDYMGFTKEEVTRLEKEILSIFEEAL
ncbi:alpha-L-rhamnosidase [Streptococcus gallolyticus]|uniref:alpha-L-rhamnosidase n=1 Tax=Streptococcus gallolyticus TaxID=315405 RepID=UPI00211CD2AB|nr:alpha-L-rhamnosidase [Streptococcus gallolyticus]MCQ9215348.1 glycoside hydrolase family 78 protein [Streptococcus gallolyticus]